MLSDPIADFLTRLRNAMQARHAHVRVPHSKLKEAMTSLLHDQGYLKSYQVVQEQVQPTLYIELKYHGKGNQPAIVLLQRASRPGLRKYAKADSLPSVCNGLGISIISTSQGVMTDKQARRQGLGGEVLCHVY